MSIRITCSKCKRKYVLFGDEAHVFRKLVQTKEQLGTILCPTCEAEKHSFICTDHSGNKAIIMKFVASCSICGSTAISLDYQFTYYSAATGYDQSLTLTCRHCQNAESMDI